MPLDPIERSVNAVSDHDTNWWPFLWLRPHKHATLTLDRLCMMALLYGAPVGTAFSLIFATLYPAERRMAPLVAAAFPILLLFVATVIVGPMWNRRAERLRKRLR